MQQGTEKMSEAEVTDHKQLFAYTHARIHVDDYEDGEQGSILEVAKGGGDECECILSGHEEKAVPQEAPTINNITASANYLWSAIDDTNISLTNAREETVGDTNGISLSLEEYKCPICLDTFINTVKVDCSYGHKFCNFCIQCWINFERHLVTECPVCRGPIFGKTLDLKTDSEIRAIYDLLSEEEKRDRLISIKERLQSEYPIPNSNHHQYSPGFQIPILSDATHHQFNHALHLPIPLLSGMEGGAVQFAPSPYPHGTDNVMQPGPGWPNGMIYPSIPSTWQCLHSSDPSNVGNVQLPQQSDQAGIRHQHYYHQNQENSRWDNSLYVIPEDYTTYNGWSSFRQTTNGTNGTHLVEQMDTGQSQEFTPSIPSYIGEAEIQLENAGPLNFFQEQNPILSPSYTPAHLRNELHQNHSISFPPNSPVTPIPITAAPPVLSSHNHVNRFYCCYVPTCRGLSHCYCTTVTPAATQFIATSPNVLQTPHFHQQGVTGCPGHHQMLCHNFIGESSGGTTNSETNLRSAVTPSRIRPNMPGTSSTTPIRLPRPNNVASNSRPETICYHRTVASSVSPSTTRQLMNSRCSVRNSRPHFSGGFSVFSTGYLQFHISHVPTTMMMGMPVIPTRLTHPLVSLIPLNQDGSSARICLTFEVHHA